MAGAATLLAGCGVHLEDDAPPIPGVPTRTVDPRAVAVARELSLVRRAGAAARAAGRAGGDLASRLAAVHVEQERVLAARVRELAEDPDGSARLPADLGEGTRGAAWPDSEALGLARGGDASESASPGDGDALSATPADEIPLILSTRVQRAVGSTLANVALAPPPAPTTASPAETARQLGAARSALYGMDVAAARAPNARDVASARDLVLRTCRALEGLPGGDTSPPALGYELPFPVPDATAAQRLAVHVLHALAAAFVAGSGAASGQEDALGTLLAWTADIEEAAVRLGGGLREFPGLQVAARGGASSIDGTSSEKTVPE